MSNEYCVGIPELFSLNWNKDPCKEGNQNSCTCLEFANKICPIGVDFFRFPSGELRLDFAHCNLNCIPCWAKQCPHQDHFNCYEDGYGFKETFNPQEIVDRIACRAQKLNEYVEANNSFQIRITGGEPFLSKKRWTHIAETLNILDNKLISNHPEYNEDLDERLRNYGKRGHPKRKRVVIQTNGIQLGLSISLKEITNLIASLEKISILLHLSFKGSNPTEFHQLTKGNPDWFNHQVDLIDQLCKITESNENFDFQIVFGFFHSDKYILWNQEEDAPMLIKPDKRFLEEIKKNWKRTYVEPLDFRFRMIEKAGTIRKSYEKGVIRDRNQILENVISKLNPLPSAGKKTKIINTFYERL